MRKLFVCSVLLQSVDDITKIELLMICTKSLNINEARGSTLEFVLKDYPRYTLASVSVMEVTQEHLDWAQQ
jgi:hypothetical protein